MFLQESRSLLWLMVFASILGAQVRPRIVAVPDEDATVRIPGSTHPLTSVAEDLGRAAANLPMERILLHLSSSPEQQGALAQLLADQQDPASPQYHRWLTPEQFGDQFGPAAQDLAVIAAWLESAGFQVAEPPAGRRAIEFSGTVEQVEAAFHTEIHRYLWNGKEHIANLTDISIPAALAPVVSGVVSLHNFGPRPLHHTVALPKTDLSGGSHGLSPYDFAAIYDVSPLWTSGYDGTGQTIAIVAETDIKVSDVTAFRSMFGLPANNPTVILNGKDPGIISGEETEGDLDVEWSGAVAKGATIDYVVSASTNTSDGITLSAEYIVEHDTAPVMSLSYGACEAEMGSANQFYSTLWQQAAAEGIAVFVAAGDTGSAGCDLPYSVSNSGADNTAPASQGFGINGLGSSIYNVVVGGTEFNDTASPSTYWNSSNNSDLASAKGYIPEVAWNESSYTAGSSSNNLYAGGGGSSTVWPRPSWQTGPGVPSGTMRLAPDVSLTAAGHDGYLVEQEGSLYQVGGTSASTPSFAGLMAILNQYTQADNGNPNANLYALAAQTPSVFHDVTGGSNAVPCEGGAPNCSASAPSTNVGTMNGYSAGVGYDMATGLGSVDANALVTNWGGAKAAPSIVSLSPNPATGSSSPQTLTVNGAGFAAGSELKVTVGSTAYQPTFVSSSQLTASVIVGTAAASLSVQVTNPSGQVSNTVTLTVSAPAAAPSITSLSPASMTGSSAAQTLTIIGSGFVSGSGLKVTVGSTAYQPTFVSSSQLTASVTVGTAAASLSVQVTNPSGQVSNTVTLKVSAPAAAPSIISLNPNPMTGSSAAQTLTINGSGFVPGSGLKVSVGSTSYQPIFISSSQLTLSVTAGAAASLPVQVTNPSGQTSNVVTLTVSPAAAPSIRSLSPNPMTGLSAAQTLTINGSGFVASSGLKVTVGSTAYQPTFVSSSQLTASVTIGTSAASLPVEITNPGGLTSNVVILTVSAPPPSIGTLTPNPMPGSSAAQTLTISGSGFVSGGGLKVTVGSTAYQPTFVSSSQLTASVTVGTAAASLPVQVTNPSGQVSAIATLTVSAPTAAPIIASLNPNPMTASDSPQTLTINGSGFQSGLKLSIGTTTVSASQLSLLTPTELQVSVITDLVANTYAVQVIDPNGATSNTVNLTVNVPPSPTISSITPNSLSKSAAPQNLIVNGGNFQSGTGLKVTVGSASYSGSQITVVSASQLQVPVTVPTAGTLSVEVTNPSGLASNAATLAVH